MKKGDRVIISIEDRPRPVTNAVLERAAELIDESDNLYHMKPVEGEIVASRTLMPRKHLFSRKPRPDVTEYAVKTSEGIFWRPKPEVTQI